MSTKPRPTKKAWAIKGIVREPKMDRDKPNKVVWMNWTDESGGWYQWGSEGWRKAFETKEDALKIARTWDVGPWYDKPDEDTIDAIEIDVPLSREELEAEVMRLRAQA